MKQFTLMPLCLHLHDAGAAGAAVGVAEGAAGNSGAVPQEALVSPGRRKEASAPQVVYGKPTDASVTPAQDASAKPGEQDAPSDKKAAFRTLIDGEYKDAFADHVQEQLDRRLPQHKALEERVQALTPLLDLLGERYQIADGDPAKLLQAVEGDDLLWEGLADEAGLSPEQFREQQKLRREVSQLRQETAQRDAMQAANQKLAQWTEQAEAMQAHFPGFDLRAELQANESFRTMLSKGVDVKTAYQAVHFDEILSGIATTAGRRAEESAMHSRQNKGKRPQEAGSGATPGALIRDDASQFTKADRQEIAHRVRRGETIRL